MFNIQKLLNNINPIFIGGFFISVSIYNKTFIMSKIVRLTESDLIKLVERVLRESKDEVEEASSPAQQAAIAINMKKKGIKPKNESLYEDEYGSVEETNYVVGDLLTEAEYQGRKVQLGKIMQGDVKKSKVYVKNDKGKVVKVNFGFGGKSAHGKRMTIKKNNPERRKNFRARMNCDNPGPRWKPRYWACRTW
jgi:hypothetical protein